MKKQKYLVLLFQVNITASTVARAAKDSLSEPSARSWPTPVGRAGTASSTKDRETGKTLFDYF